MSIAAQLGYWCGTGLASGAAAYAVLAWLAVALRSGSEPVHCGALPPVTVMKPLCGAEPALYDCLRSFCLQAYPRFQLLCGVREPHDPAVSVVRRLQTEFPHLELELSIDPTPHGSSGKVANLLNMMPRVRHDYLIIADSDVRVTADYLAGIVGPLQDPGVGIVTCPYRGLPGHGLWSLLGSMFINDWFMPSVRVAALLGSRAFAFGATIGVRREVLAGVGGFAALADQLADDYRLGELTRAAGRRTVLSAVVVATCIDERSLAELVRHELRWLRTVRAVRPLGYALSLVTFGLPAAALGSLAAGGARAALGLLALTAAARVMLHCTSRNVRASLSQLWALPLSDALVFVLWCWSFATRRVYWRQQRYRVARDGSAHPLR